MQDDSRYSENREGPTHLAANGGGHDSQWRITKILSYSTLINAVVCIAFFFLYPGYPVSPQTVGALVVFTCVLGIWVLLPLINVLKRGDLYVSNLTGIFLNRPRQLSSPYLLHEPRILVITDDSSVGVYNSIQEKYADKGLFAVSNFRYSNDNFTEKGLRDALVNADGIYLCRTATTVSEDLIHNTVLRWSRTEPHKPVLVVDCLGEDRVKRWHFPKSISPNQVTTGLWLLERAIDRGGMWYNQSKREWIAFMFVIFLLAISLVGSAWERSKLNDRIELERNNLNDRIRADSVVIHSRENLFRLAFRSLIELGPAGQAGLYRLSFWRAFKDRQTDKQLVVKIAGTEISFGNYFPIESSIISGSIRRDAVILWKRNMVSGETLAWDHFGRGIGRFDAKVGGIIVSVNDILDTVRYEPVSDEQTNRKAMFCVGFYSKINNVRSGVCFEIPDDNSVLLQKVAIRDHLCKIADQVNIFSDSQINTQGRLDFWRSVDAMVEH